MIPRRKTCSTSLQEPDLKEILLGVKNSLHVIDAKIDLLTSSPDLMKGRVDKLEDLLDHLEAYISGTDNTQTVAGEHLLHMDKVLEIIKLKNEDLKARSWQNNLFIIEVLESTAINRMEDFVKTILRSLFVDSLSSVFIVHDAVLRQAREHCFHCFIHFQGNEASFNPEFMLAVQVACRAFLSANRMLQMVDVPAQLRIFPDGNLHYFMDDKSTLKFSHQILE
ncbi:hypothetical protein NDU88_006233 [Pleurodeles waltl]|uniref:Uncharacterized protein n=1 Tax=Pleurodeles waltl TaxID=8319 RepID=A0AAV7WE35_PLEWA|nr:hypothetical protein NDU88_006233 [Pleurodeles waltl]